MLLFNTASSSPHVTMETSTSHTYWECTRDVSCTNEPTGGSSTGKSSPSGLAVTYITIAAVSSFSLGLLVASVITCVCCIRLKSSRDVPPPLPPPYSPPPLPPLYSPPLPPDTWDADSIELEKNDAYGTVQKMSINYV